VYLWTSFITSLSLKFSCNCISLGTQITRTFHLFSLIDQHKFCPFRCDNLVQKFVFSVSFIHSFINSFIPLAYAECDDSLPFSGRSSIPLCYVLLHATLLHQLYFCPPSLHLSICFLVHLSTLLFQNSYIILLWELKFSVRVQTNVIYLTLLSLL
jgi:hypothetical protein